MGVKELWAILTPYCTRKSLYELHGKVVAVDLAGWVCEALTVVEYSVQPRFYLRNLYFRTCYLLLLGVSPVFVLEGKAPTLKYDTIAQRNAIQFKGARPKKKSSPKPGKDRTRFNSILKQCADLLKTMGIQCVQGWGEAEAMCAFLNHRGLVDGCISQDSDCFVYGAQVVYRNFSVSQQGSASSAGGSVDIYDIQSVPTTLDFGRNKMVALALLCGCDYQPDGIPGVGRDTALKFIHSVKDSEIISRLQSWSTDTAYFESLENEVNNPNICTSCGHDGKIQKHSRSGCDPCGRAKGCMSEHYKEKRLILKNELQIRAKALLINGFPNQTLIDEFLRNSEPVPSFDLSWSQPNLVGFVLFTTKMLQWTEIYAFEKFLPILTRWQLLNYEKNQPGALYPDFIKKVRTPKGVPSYEIIWTDPEKLYGGLIPDSQIEELKRTSVNSNIAQEIWSTIEPQDLVLKAYPKLVEKFLNRKNKKSSKGTKNNRKRNGNINLEDSFATLTIEKRKKNNNAKCVTKINKNENQIGLVSSKKIHDYFKTNAGQATVTNESHCNATPGEGGGRLTSYTSYLQNGVLDESDISMFNDDTELNLSVIVENLVCAGNETDLPMSSWINNIGARPPSIDENRTLGNETCAHQHESSFFRICEEEDIFEKTYNGKCFNISSSDDSESET